MSRHFSPADNGFLGGTTRDLSVSDDRILHYSQTRRDGQNLNFFDNSAAYQFALLPASLELDRYLSLRDTQMTFP